MSKGLFRNRLDETLTSKSWQSPAKHFFLIPETTTFFKIKVQNDTKYLPYYNILCVNVYISLSFQLRGLTRSLLERTSWWRSSTHRASLTNQRAAKHRGQLIHWLTDQSEAWMLLDCSTLSSQRLFCTLCPNKDKCLNPCISMLEVLFVCSSFRNFWDVSSSLWENKQRYVKSHTERYQWCQLFDRDNLIVSSR